MAHADNRVTLNNKKTTHRNMDESHRYNDQQKKPDTDIAGATRLHLYKIKS